MKKVGTHLVVEAWQTPGDVLNDPEQIRSALVEAVFAGGATLLNLCVHQFSPDRKSTRLNSSHYS